MRFITMLLFSTALALPAMAQTTTKHHRAHHSARHATTRSQDGGVTSSGERVNDKGPYTPEANRAYNGGGAVIESAPGNSMPSTGMSGSTGAGMGSPGAGGMPSSSGTGMSSGMGSSGMGTSGAGMTGSTMSRTR